jgi:uncharacterized protein
MSSRFFALFDDIALLLDDVAVLTKAAAKKNVGILGDDLALNAEQVAGVKADRELPVVWAVAKGAFVNKLILVPAALLLAAFVPWAITPLMILGGAFLCYEGATKVLKRFLQSKEDARDHHAKLVAAVANQQVDMVQFEKDKIKGAIRTDFILSAEVIVITLGTMAATTAFETKLAVVSIMALAMTVGVYGLVAAIVKIDDLGLRLTQSASTGIRALGNALLRFAPRFMKALSIAGTVAMFMVGGGILTHSWPALYQWAQSAKAQLQTSIGGFASLLPMMVDLIVGLVLGAILVAIFRGIKSLFSSKATAS